MPNYDHFFRSDWFKSPIKEASFERISEATPLESQSSNLGSQTRKRSCAQMQLTHLLFRLGSLPFHPSLSRQFSKTRSEWTEFDDDYSTFRISWERSSDGPIDPDPVIGKTITRITDYTWRTVIELGDLMFINVEFNATSYSDRDGSCCAQIGTWTNKDQGEATELGKFMIGK